MKVKYYDIVDSGIQIIFMINKGALESNKEGQYHFLEHLLATVVCCRTNEYHHINCFNHLDGRTDNHYLYISVSNFKSEEEIINYLLKYIDFIESKTFNKHIYENEKQMVINENKNKMALISYNFFLFLTKLLINKNGTNGNEDSLIDSEMIKLKKNISNDDYSVLFINLYDEMKIKINNIIDNYNENNKIKKDKLTSSFNINFDYKNDSKLIHYYTNTYNNNYFIILLNVDEYLYDLISCHQTQDIYICLDTIIISVNINNNIHKFNIEEINNIILNKFYIYLNTLINNDSQNLILNVNKLYLLTYKYPDENLNTLDKYLITKINKNNVKLKKYYLFKTMSESYLTENQKNITYDDNYNIYYETKILEDLDVVIKIINNELLNKDIIFSSNNNEHNKVDIIFNNDNVYIVNDMKSEIYEIELVIRNILDIRLYCYDYNNIILLNIFNYMISLGMMEKNLITIGNKAIVSEMGYTFLEIKNDVNLKKGIYLFIKNIEKYYIIINDIISIIKNFNKPLTKKDNKYLNEIDNIRPNKVDLFYITDYKINKKFDNNFEFSYIKFDYNFDNNMINIEEIKELSIDDVNSSKEQVKILKSYINNRDENIYYFISNNNYILYYSFIKIYLIPILLRQLMKQRIIYSFNYNVSYGFNHIIFYINNKIDFKKQFINSYETSKLTDNTIYKINIYILIRDIVKNMLLNDIKKFNNIKFSLSLKMDIKIIDKIIYSMFS